MMILIHSQTTHRGNVREQNEDSCENKETRNGHFFVTCDGMGGAAEGKKASSIAVRSIFEFFEKETYENIQIALYQSLQFANEQIYATSQANPAYKGMGTTACVVVFRNDDMYFAHVGDSRIYLQTDGKLKYLTRDHSFVNQLVDQGTINPAEAKTHPEKNRILKALGVNPQVESTVSSQPTLLKKGDVVLLCSDGLTDMVPDATIAEILNREKSIAEKADLLLQKALDNGGKDNITIQLVEIIESPHTKTNFIDRTPKDLSATLTGEDNPINTKRRKLSKKYLFVLVPILLIGFYFLFKESAEDVKELPVAVIECDGLDYDQECNAKVNEDSLGTSKNSINNVTIAESDSLNVPTSQKMDDNSRSNSSTNGTIPEFVKLDYSNPDPENGKFQKVSDIIQKYPSLTEKEILRINRKKNSTDFIKSQNVYLNEDAYKKAHPNNKEMAGLEKPAVAKLNKDESDKKEASNNEGLLIKNKNESTTSIFWEPIPTYVIYDKNGKMDPKNNKVNNIFKIRTEVINISEKNLYDFNDVQSIDELSKKEIIYLTPEKIGPK
ncbi:MAG: Stp1/IreP family PP2C-type Ser/Thr phosphatase [Aequorivita sp.]